MTSVQEGCPLSLLRSRLDNGQNTFIIVLAAPSFRISDLLVEDTSARQGKKNGFSLALLSLNRIFVPIMRNTAIFSVLFVAMALLAIANLLWDSAFVYLLVQHECGHASAFFSID